MKYTFVSSGDFHLTLKKDVPKDWQVGRYLKLFEVIIAECLEREARLILTGDLFDRNNPSLEELKLMLEFFYMLEDNKIHAVIVAGNHCGIAKNDNVLDYLHLNRFGPRKGFSYISYGETVIIDDHIRIEPLDHDKLHVNFARNVNNPYGKFRVLVSHFRPNLNEYIKEEVDVAKLREPFDLVIVGDIHDELEFDNVYYTNNPLNCQFEFKPNCSFILLEIEDRTYNITRIPTDLPNLIQKECAAEEFTAVQSELDAKHFYRVNVTGTAAELKTVPSVGPNFKTVKVLREEHQFNFDEETILLPKVDGGSGLVTRKKVNSLEEQFADFMVTSGYNESLVSAMITVLREV